MNYRHAFHAGNFVDVFKHLVLIALVEAMQRKENGFCYLDTHAGIGKYDLSSPAALKTREFETGIAKIIKLDNPPELVQTYLKCVKALNEDEILKFYPGSPFFVRHFLRSQDRMILCEWQQDDYETLKRFFARDKQVAVHHQDGYQALKAFLPPKEKRGLVLIDPPYEKADEYEQLVDLLPTIIRHWETGVYALWYPIKERRASQHFIERLKNKISRPVWVVEQCIYPDNIATHLNGSGMFIVNPPWQLDVRVEFALPLVLNALRL